MSSWPWGEGAGATVASEPMRLLERCGVQDRGFSGSLPFRGGHGGEGAAAAVGGGHSHLHQPTVPAQHPQVVWFRLPWEAKVQKRGPARGRPKSQRQTGSPGPPRHGGLADSGRSLGALTLPRPVSENTGSPSSRAGWLPPSARPRLTLAQLGSFLLSHPLACIQHELSASQHRAAFLCLPASSSRLTPSLSLVSSTQAVPCLQSSQRAWQSHLYR